MLFQRPLIVLTKSSLHITLGSFSQSCPPSVYFDQLLIVIGIIGALAGIVIPVVGAANERGDWTKDTNNLRQLGAGVIDYMGERPRKFLPFPLVSERCFNPASHWRVAIKNKYFILLMISTLVIMTSTEVLEIR